MLYNSYNISYIGRCMFEKKVFFLTKDTAGSFVRSHSEGIILHPLVLVHPLVLHHGALQQQIVLLVADNVVLCSQMEIIKEFLQKSK